MQITFIKKAHWLHLSTCHCVNLPRQFYQVHRLGYSLSQKAKSIRQLCRLRLMELHFNKARVKRAVYLRLSGTAVGQTQLILQTNWILRSLYLTNN